MSNTDYEKSLKAADDLNFVARMGFDLSMQVSETQDAFIFNTIKPFIEQYTTIEISKEELIRAVQLVQMQKEAINKYGVQISNEWNTAAAQSAALEKAYIRGFTDGKMEMRERILSYINGNSGGDEE